ncbi:unnamed protein product, partial [Discosporangium mesarthrocarpum]
KSHYRGHEIECRWFYRDTGGPVADHPDRHCGYCERANTPEGHDGCLGTLPDVQNACCGHGVTDEAYIQYPDGRRVSGLDALELIDQLK